MTDHSAGMWERMRRNAEENAVRFPQLGLGRDQVPVIDCRECGTTESGLFWSLTEVSGSDLHLHCPTCHTYGVRYNVARGELVHSRSLRGRFGLGTTELVAICMLLIGIGAGGSVATDGRLARHVWDVTRVEAQRIEHGMKSAVQQVGRRPSGGGSALPKSIIPAARGQEGIYFASGDQRENVRAHVKEIGPRDAQLLQSVDYLPADHQSRLILGGDSRAWRRYRARCGWNMSAASATSAGSAPCR